MKVYKCINQNEKVMSMNEGMTISGEMSVHKAESVHKTRNVNEVTSVPVSYKNCPTPDLKTTAPTRSASILSVSPHLHP